MSTGGELLEIAVRAARAGGEVVARSAGRRIAAEAKASGDYVSAVDRESEDAVRTVLETEGDGIPVLAEEGGGRTGDRYWAVDPLDGTTNHLRGFPIVAVSVALVASGAPVVGVVHAPFLGETYVGDAGGGAFVRRAGREAERLRVSGREPGAAVVGTGFPFRSKARLPRYLPVLERALGRFEDLRRPGAAALDLAWVAAGVFDGFFELNLSRWDVAAGALLVREAGGVVTDWDGGDAWLETGDILAGSPAVHAALAEITSA